MPSTLARRALSHPLVLSLIPWVAFLVTLLVADSVAEETGSLAGLLCVAPFYLPFVALPALLPLVAARHRTMMVVGLAVMTATAICAAATMVASDDAQAGLAVFLVPYVAVPLAALLWAGEALAHRLSGRGDATTGGMEG